MTWWRELGLLLLLAICWAWWNQEPFVELSYRPLTRADVLEISRALDSLDIRHEMDDHQVYIAESRLHEVRIELARLHLPDLKRVALPSAGRSPVQQATAMRQSEISLSETVRRLPFIEEAYVKQAVPENHCLGDCEDGFSHRTGRILLKSQGPVETHVLAHLARFADPFSATWKFIDHQGDFHEPGPCPDHVDSSRRGGVKPGASATAP